MVETKGYRAASPAATLLRRMVSLCCPKLDMSLVHGKAQLTLTNLRHLKLKGVIQIV